MNPELTKLAFRVAEQIMLLADEQELNCGISIWKCLENPWMIVRCREQGGTLAIQRIVSDYELELGLSESQIAQQVVEEFVAFREAIAS